MKNRRFFNNHDSSVSACLITLFFTFIIGGIVFSACNQGAQALECNPWDQEQGGTDSNQSWSWGETDIDKAIKKLSYAMVEQAKLKEKPVLISPHDLYDAQSGLSLPLATLLRGKLMTEMKKRGVRILLPGADDERCMILQGTWQKQGEDLSIDLKIMKLGEDGPEAVASASEKVPIKKIDPEALTPDRESWARYIVRKLESNSPSRESHALHLSTFKVGSKTHGCAELGQYMAGWMRPALAQSSVFLPIDQQNAMKDLSVSTLRTRGMRAIRPELPSGESSPSLTADLLEADGELKGEVWLHKEKVEVRVRVTDRKGCQVTAASADIPAHLFPAELLNPPEEVVSIPEVLKDPGAPGLSKNGLMVELTTTRGDGQAFYRKDEHIRFIIRLNRPAWVYLFDLDPEGNAALLYPVDQNGLLASDARCGSIIRPDVPFILPEDGCSYKLVVTEPYGKDRVMAVASEIPLTFPPDLSEGWSKADFLVQKLRNQGLSRNSGYGEAQVEIITGP